MLIEVNRTGKNRVKCYVQSRTRASVCGGGRLVSLTWALICKLLSYASKGTAEIENMKN